MKPTNGVPWMLLALQLVINVSHISIHYLALNLLWTKSAAPSAFSKLLIYGGGLSCIAFIARAAGQLQRRQNREEPNFPGAGTEATGMVLLIMVSFVVEGLTLYLVQ